MLLGAIVMAASAAGASGGTFTEFKVPDAMVNDLHGISAGPDGNVWFTVRGANKIGRITPSGRVTEFPIPTAAIGPDDR